MPTVCPDNVLRKRFNRIMPSFCCYHMLGLALALGSAAQAATYEVAQRNPHASDEGPGTTQRPWKTIAKAAVNAGQGDVVIIRDGVYRERVLVKNSGTKQSPIRFEAAVGEHVVITGADRLTGWRKGDDAKPTYSITWPHKFIGWNRSMAHPDDEYHRTIGRCEQVAVDGYLLRQVLNADQLAPGAFFVDVTNKTLFVWDVENRDLNKTHVEASVRQEVLRVEGDHVQVRGLRFRYAANMAQHGAVVLAGRHDTMEDCVVEAVNASGATFLGQDAVVRRCVFRDNGQLGFGASRAHRLLFTECLVENNNTKGFDRGWEAGGDKLVLCRDAVLERSRFVRNRGTGIWFDIGNTNCTVQQCLIADNEDAGIFYEISFRLHAHDNVIVGNGFAATAGAWGAQAGISLSSSPGGVVERNLIVGNREGFNFREQTRTTPTIEDPTSHAVWNHDELIRHNAIALNRDAQVWGWFDVKDNRHWPVNGVPPNETVSVTAAKPADIVGAYGAKSARGQPQGLTLDKLQLRFEQNVYFAAPGQGWFRWGPTWARNKSYAALSEFRSDLGIDADSQVIDPGFANVHELDLRLRAEVMALFKECYPQGPVPGVILGVTK
jgi:hypothetical protein